MRKVLFVLLIAISTNLFAQKLVLPGDHPDPSVVKIGDTYWASATTSNWFPAYPLLHSKDLIHWQQSGFVFDTLPKWADYYFWAPEISYDNGKVYVYYAAHKKGGNLCVAVAEADKPEGPYKDLGPLICQPAGSIDAFPMRDENGKLYIIWKEDGNSIGQPTPIWAQQLSEDRTKLIGEKKELFRNTAMWEGNLVEGVSIIRHEGYFYAIYAANACCGASCTYGVGVARAKSLLGPWEKDERNPVLTSGAIWKCPGHGTAIEKNGKYYLLHHAYNAATTIYAGRQGVLTEFKFNRNGWIDFIKDTATTVAKPTLTVHDFIQKDDRWQWSVFKNVHFTSGNGSLLLNALPDISGAYLGQSVLTTNYKVDVTIDMKRSTSEAGVALIADDKNILYASVRSDKMKVVSVKDSIETVLMEKPITETSILHLVIKVRDNNKIKFSYSKDGKTFEDLNKETVEPAFLPPWDRALRVGIISKGNEDEKAVFKRFVFDSY